MNSNSPLMLVSSGLYTKDSTQHFKAASRLHVELGSIKTKEEQDDCGH